MGESSGACRTNHPHPGETDTHICVLYIFMGVKNSAKVSSTQGRTSFRSFSLVAMVPVKKVYQPIREQNPPPPRLYRTNKLVKCIKKCENPRLKMAAWHPAAKYDGAVSVKKLLHLAEVGTERSRPTLHREAGGL